MQHETSSESHDAAADNVAWRRSTTSATNFRPATSDSLPKLLVSVRSAAEAEAAIRGGCDIVDVKEPLHGSLGRADAAVIQEVIQQVHRTTREQINPVAVTAALGEIFDYPRDHPLPVPAELNLVKLGCARLAGDGDWRSHWARVRELVARQTSPATGWVGVIYADWQQADAPRPAEIASESLRAGCHGVLVDTYTKSGRGLFDWMSTVELQRLAEQVHSAGRFLALAGSLRIADLTRLREIPVDIVAIRGAACQGGLRTDQIDEAAVARFRLALARSFQQPLETPSGAV